MYHKALPDECSAIYILWIHKKQYLLILIDKFYSEIY